MKRIPAVTLIKDAAPELDAAMQEFDDELGRWLDRCAKSRPHFKN